MANTLSKPTSTIPDKAAALRPQIEFVQWGIPFLGYLVKEKGPTLQRTCTLRRFGRRAWAGQLDGSDLRFASAGAFRALHDHALQKVASGIIRPLPRGVHSSRLR
jgi:hypothetical protein